MDNSAAAVDRLLILMPVLSSIHHRLQTFLGWTRNFFCSTVTMDLPCPSNDFLLRMQTLSGKCAAIWYDSWCVWSDGIGIRIVIRWVVKLNYPHLWPGLLPPISFHLWGPAEIQLVFTWSHQIPMPYMWTLPRLSAWQSVSYMFQCKDGATSR